MVTLLLFWLKFAPADEFGRGLEAFGRPAEALGLRFTGIDLPLSPDSEALIVAEVDRVQGCDG